MKFLADEYCDALLVEAGREDGFDVLDAIESLRGADEILTRANTEERMLVTEDREAEKIKIRENPRAFASRFTFLSPGAGN